MPTLSTHAIEKYYQEYGTRELAFNKSVVRVLGLEPKKVYLKVKDDQYSCIVYSCSMMAAKVIANLDSVTFDALKKANNFVNLRMSFLPYNAKTPIVFYIPSTIDGYKNFNSNSPNTFLLNLRFNKKPPDDLIEFIGKILQEKDNFEKRQDVRVSLDNKIIADIGIASTKAIAVIDNIKRPCILRNISVSGASVIMSCAPKLLMNKKVFLNILSKQTGSAILIEGTAVRFDNVEGRNDIYGIAIQFAKENVPLEYKVMLNAYLDKLEELIKRK